MAKREWNERRRATVKKYRASEKGKKNGREYRQTEKAKNTLKNRVRNLSILKEKYYNAIARVAHYKTCIAIARIQNVPEDERHEVDTTN